MSSLVCGFLSLAAALDAAATEPAAVDVVNGTWATRCAEVDNVYVTLSGADVRHFRIEAVHPAYIGTITTDSTEPDMEHCDFSSDPGYAFTARTVVLFENDELFVIGFTFAQFWRPDVVGFTVDGREEVGLHRIELFRKVGDRRIRFLELYPSDGYWRVKPLPAPHLQDNILGSSFLIGPVEEQGRPIVDLRSIAFDPASRTFDIAFARGGEATLQVGEISAERTVLEVSLEPGVAAGRPFTALRSMHVSPANADVAQVAWRPAQGSAWQAQSILAFEQARAVEVRFGRTDVSLHNTSAPDLIFGGFLQGVATVVGQ